MRSILNNRGFTLIEIIVVVAIISIMSALTVPNLANYLGSERKNTSILLSYIATVADDSFVKIRNNYLSIQLESPSGDEKDNFKNSDNRNSIAVYTMKDKKFIISKNRLLKNIEFPKNFRLESLSIDNGDRITSGNIFIPFYSNGESLPFKLTIQSDDNEFIIEKKRIIKRPILVNDAKI